MQNNSDPLQGFHPIIRRWFQSQFREATEAQRRGWPAIQARQDTLIAAPTGSGKTLAAFLASLDGLLRLALTGELQDQTYVVYVSPLRALSNDIQRNLQGPLSEILELARQERPDCPEIRALVRTGDTSPGERQRMVRRPPHILVTTPESLYLVLTGKRSRTILQSVQTVIVDEIHAVARDKRGSHLALSLERLDELCRVARPESSKGVELFENDTRPSQSPRACHPPVRIGLSATQKPLEELAQFLVGSFSVFDTPRIVDIGHVRDMDLGVEVPQMELQAVCTHEHWAEIYERLVQLINEHRSTLIFVNTRKLAERVAHQLTERLGKEHVQSHHGSLAHRSRQRTEQGLKNGSLKAVVATASLELGIDIGHIDLVCQLGTPRSIATFLQRVGRAGHSLGRVPKGRLFALSREELVECAALIRAVRERRLDKVEIPKAPLDILAQQLVAMVACDEWEEDALFGLCRRPYPYRDLSREDFDDVLEMLSEGIAPERGRWGAYLHRDRVNHRVRPRKAARLTAITCGGAIPEIASYRVVTGDENRTVVGTLDEDFAVESNAGDIFLLGNTSWRIKHVRGGEVVVTDAQGAPPTIPFWVGEAPGRTLELSAEVARLREELIEANSKSEIRNSKSESNLAQRREDAKEQSLGALAALRETAVSDFEFRISDLAEKCGLSAHAAEQLVAYDEAQQAATGMVPTQKRLLFERFFDESGGMQLVVHAPFGTRINRAWGLAMRKRFCRSFDFELQASANDNGVVLSLGAQHSFPLEQMFKLVPSHLARDVLVQAFLAVPFFGTRWRWNVTRALQQRRFQRGQRVPPHLQRMRAEDLLSAVFPAQTACQENVVGDIVVPDQPIVRQTVNDCLHEASDLDGLLNVLRGIESGAIEVVGLDTREPSPFAHELLNVMPYAFLDDAPLEERRARAVSLRRTLSVEALRDLTKLDPEAIAQVKADAWPLVRDADELHDVLLSQGALPIGEGRAWTDFFDELRSAGRATETQPLPPTPLPGSVRGAWPEGSGVPFWVATERWPLIGAIWPEARSRPEISVPPEVRQDWSHEEAVVFLVRGRMECMGPTTVTDLARDLSLNPSHVEGALLALENQGSVLRGRFTGADELEWCDRRLLARIHRLTLEGLRQQIAPVSPEQFMQFLLRHQHLHAQTRLHGQTGLLALIEQLEGFEAPAGHWEKYLLSARLESYSSNWLDNLTFFGQAVWGRLAIRNSKSEIRNPKSESNLAQSRKEAKEEFLGDLAASRESDVSGPEFPRGRPMKAMTRATPITLMHRDHVGWLLPQLEENADLSSHLALGSNARAAYECFLRHGALFPNQLGTLLQLVPAQVDDVLGELAAAGLVTSDGYPALRSLIGLRSFESAPTATDGEGSPDHRRWLRARRRAWRARAHTGAPVGRWTLLRSALTPAVETDERTEQWCRLLLRRYGVMFRDLLANESASPPWHALVRTYRRLEARGEIRGGRFVAGVAGEQYALPEVIRLLRSSVTEADEKPLILPATDPINLTGRVGPGPRVPASAGYSITLYHGDLKQFGPAMGASADVQGHKTETGLARS
jgi:ATP-dependent Lhr-like helicase